MALYKLLLLFILIGLFWILAIFYDADEIMTLLSFQIVILGSMISVSR